MKCQNCGLLNPDTALRCDCGYNFTSGGVEESYAIPGERHRIRTFFIQWAIFSVIGALAFRSFVQLSDHFHIRPPFAIVVALMPAYIFLGMFFMDLPPSRAATVLDAVASVWDAMYYGIVLLIAWRVLMFIVKRTAAPRS